ncbi:hypothetical protein GF327_02870 [Candidatus Woesearchaeota archaeon]|nr:hypothetical protein [Candidatus Woesearchaeota archaeon]
MKKFLCIYLILGLAFVQSVFGLATITDVTSPLPDGVYYEGAVIPIEVVFSEPVFVEYTDPVNHHIGMVMDTKETIGWAFYGSGNGTNNLIFNILIGMDMNSCDLAYTQLDFWPYPKIDFGHGNIVDANGLQVDPKLPTPGEAGSLDFNKEIITLSVSWPPVLHCNVQSPIDNDGEGYTSDIDCDDTDPEVNPGASEVCDEIDNDCDGTVDEGVKDTYYYDGDSDLYGDSGDTIQSCSSPTGYVTDGTDCDDTDPEVNPGASEVCDEIDNDCDGLDMDKDKDGVNDCSGQDYCFGSEIPDFNLYQEIKINRYALIDHDTSFDTRFKNSKNLGPKISLKQILDCKFGDNDAKYKFACDQNALKEWIHKNRKWMKDCLGPQLR